MHYAQIVGKCQLHILTDYADCMDTPAERLKLAREEAGFGSAREAALAMGISYDTYIHHERGTRGITASSAESYARRFRVASEWILYGKGVGPAPSTDPTDDDLASMIENALRELPVGVPLGEFPRLVAPALRVQLERFRADREA